MRVLECGPSTSRALLALIVIMTGLMTVVYVFDVERLQLLRAIRKTRSARLSQWTWTCERRSCVRREWGLKHTQPPWMGLATCRMTCGHTQVIWPKPTGTVTLGNTSSAFDIDKIKFRLKKKLRQDTTSIVYQALDLFKGNLRTLASEENLAYIDNSEESRLEVKLVIQDLYQTLLSLETNEGYKLQVERKEPGRVVVTVTAGTFYGARHGLETLAQLIWWDDGEVGLGTFRLLDNVTVEDEPMFSYRGLMVDTARNFISMTALRRTVDGMAVSKLNVLHLHLTDSQSFPFQSPRFPQMALYGAYSPEEVYTAQELRELTAYAQVRGVRLLPEIDVPAHAGFGWQWGERANLGALAVCVNQQPWRRYCGQPPCGQLNPSNNNTYLILRGLYQDLVELSNVTDLFHIGGDEINQYCWTSSPEVFENQYTTTEQDFWDKVNEFHQRALNEFVVANEGVRPSGIIVWSNSDMPDNEFVRTFPPEVYVVQEWGGSTWRSTTEHLRMRYRVILSHVDAWYLDCGFGPSSPSLGESCGPVTPVRQVYEHRPWERYDQTQQKQVLGGEACLWSEKADEHTLDSRLWPRAAALAERLWSDPLTSRVSWDDVFLRLALHRDRLVARGVRSEVVWPQWCNDNPGEC